jgi:hypothetical protein
MKVAFAGPSLYGIEVDTTGIVLRGPAVQGDITHAVTMGATVIGLIDGAFASVAAVWHKEILFALSVGVEVYGASSMGALRAAECAAFGMIPVGKIAQAYLSGEIDDDAAVALTMGPAELGWQPFTEPLVDAIATLDHLRSLGQLDQHQHARLLATAKSLHFTVRTPDTIVSGCYAGGEAARLRLAYGRHHVPQKQLDAIELIRRLQQRPHTPSPPPVWHFEPSPMWRSFAH